MYLIIMKSLLDRSLVLSWSVIEKGLFCAVSDGNPADVYFGCLHFGGDLVMAVEPALLR